MKKVGKDMLLCLFIVVCTLIAVVTCDFTIQLVKEYSVKEDVATMDIVNISTYDPNGTDCLYLEFKFNLEGSSKEYSSHIFTLDKSYKVGDSVQVVTRDGIPKELLCETARKEKRSVIDRFIDIGMKTTLLIHEIVMIGIIVLILSTAGDILIESFTSRKRFTITATILYIVAIICSSLMLFVGGSLGGWDGLGWAVMGILGIVASTCITIVTWFISSIVLHKRENKNTMKAM